LIFPRSHPLPFRSLDLLGSHLIEVRCIWLLGPALCCNRSSNRSLAGTQTVPSSQPFLLNLPLPFFEASFNFFPLSGGSPVPGVPFKSFQINFFNAYLEGSLLDVFLENQILLFNTPSEFLMTHDEGATSSLPPPPPDRSRKCGFGPFPASVVTLCPFSIIVPHFSEGISVSFQSSPLPFFPLIPF